GFHRKRRWNDRGPCRSRPHGAGWVRGNRSRSPSSDGPHRLRFSRATADICGRPRVSVALQVPDARTLFERMRGRKILVVGDLMIDEWIWGTVSRISPE